MGAYGIFYLRSGEALGGQYQVNDPAVNVVFALVTAGVALWALREVYHRRLRERFGNRRTALYVEALVAGALGAYMGVVLTWTNDLQRPLRSGHRYGDGVRGRLARPGRAAARLPPRERGEIEVRVSRNLAAIAGAAIGVVCGVALANAGGSKLYLSWVVSCLFAGMVGLAFYRGLYVQIIQRTRVRA